jgi:hypothetical protein
METAYGSKGYVKGSGGQRETYLPEPSPKDLSRHPKGESDRAGAAAPAPSLVLKNNRNRPCYCGRMSLMGIGAASRGKVIRLGCKTWRCPSCGPKKATRVRHAIAAQAAKRNLCRFLTLTLNPKVCRPEDSIKHIKSTWNKFRVILQRKTGCSITFIAVIEFQKNGYAHLHILVDRYLRQQWVSKAWQAVGGGSMVDIRQVDLHRVAAYLSKYLTKDIILGRNDQKYRRYTTSRDIRLFEKPEKGQWLMFKVAIEQLFIRHWPYIVEEQHDETGTLTAFSFFPGRF